MRAFAIGAALLLAACGASNTGMQAAAPASAAAALQPHDLAHFFDCLQHDSGALVSAHRGGPAPGFAENSVETFANTVRQAPVALEIDIARTKDGKLVLMHDETLERTTTGHGPVSASTLAEIQALSLRDNDGQTLAAHPPTLQQALEWAAGKAILELDIKRDVPYEDVIAAVRAAHAENRVILITYTDGQAFRLHRLAPDLMMTATIEDEAQLQRFIANHVDLSRIIAWTGTEEPNAALNVALAQRGVESAFGTLGRPDQSWDARFARGEGGGYPEFAETGLELIASDRPLDAYRALDAADGDGSKPVRCAADN